MKEKEAFSEHEKLLENQAALLNREQMHCFVKPDHISDLGPSIVFATNNYNVYLGLRTFLKNSFSIKFKQFSECVDDDHPRRYRTRIEQNLTDEQFKQLQQYVETSTPECAEKKASRGFFGCCFGKDKVVDEPSPIAGAELKVG